MKKPFAIISDQHFHDWSAFASTNENGINTRLQYQLDELRRCATELRKAGGDTIYNAGDTFHVRGSLSPSVLNPVMDLHRELIKEGFKIIVLAGNHDLASKTSNRLNSAVTALEGVGCRVINTTALDIDGVVMVPWVADVTALKLELTGIASDMSAEDLSHTSLIIHAPVDGVIVGIPDHGLSGEFLSELGFNRVFSGHYHSHKEVCEGVWSIGASCQQTWSDVGSKAGFLIVSDKEVKWFKSHAPEFIEITAETEPGDIELLVDGHFVRAKINSTKVSDINGLREMMVNAGAKGVTVMAQKALAAASREGGTLVKEGATLSASVTDYIKSQGFGREVDLTLLCSKILLEVSEVTA